MSWSASGLNGIVLKTALAMSESRVRATEASTPSIVARPSTALILSTRSEANAMQVANTPRTTFTPQRLKGQLVNALNPGTRLMLPFVRHQMYHRLTPASLSQMRRNRLQRTTIR